MIAEGLAGLATPIETLHEFEGNPRRGDVPAVARSLAQFTQRKPIVAKRDGTVIAGNHTLRAARELGWSEVAVVFVDDDDATAKAYALADNRTAELGGYDDEALLTLIAEVQEGDAALMAATGWSESDLAVLLGADVRAGLEPYNPAPTSDDYYTPAWVFETLALKFDLDVASPPNAPEWIPAKRRYTIEDDGLTAPWKGLVWMNPPYSRPGPWVERFLAHGNGVALLPFSNSQWWRDLWAKDLAMAVHQPAAVSFVGGASRFPPSFLAAGPVAEAALPRVGCVRRLGASDA